MLLVQGPQLEQGAYGVYSRERKHFNDKDSFLKSRSLCLYSSDQDL